MEEKEREKEKTRESPFYGQCEVEARAVDIEMIEGKARRVV